MQPHNMQLAAGVPIAGTNVEIPHLVRRLPELTPGTTYEFCGEGLGIPGLPHQVTTEDAQALGVVDTLRAALANGSYHAVGAVVTPTSLALTIPPAIPEE